MHKTFTYLAAAFAILASVQTSVAQQAPNFTRIGTLMNGTPVTHGHYLDWLRQGLREIGYLEGRNFVFVSRWGEGNNKRLRVMASELVKAKVDVFFVMGDSLRTIARATRTIPIVSGMMPNIVEMEIVGGLPRPGGNITGSTFDRFALMGKLLGLLREHDPGARRIGFLFYPSKIGLRTLESTEVAARHLGIKINPFPVRTIGDIEQAFVSMGKEPPNAVIIPTSGVTGFHRKRIAALAIAGKIPTACDIESFAEAGCLITYTADRKQTVRRAAFLIDKILKGAKPNELPVEMASKYDLEVNLRTAKALGITLPPTILLQATRVIE